MKLTAMFAIIWLICAWVYACNSTKHGLQVTGQVPALVAGEETTVPPTYNVYRATGTGSFIEIVSGLSSPSYFDQNIAAHTTYRYYMTTSAFMLTDNGYYMPKESLPSNTASYSVP